MQEVIANRGKTNRNHGVHARLLQLRGPSNRRQDGNYNGGFAAYTDHIAAVEADLEAHFDCTRG